MSSNQVQTTGNVSGENFKEWVTAIIGLGVIVVFCVLAIIAAYAAVSSDTADASFQQLKDLLTFLSGLVGTVVGYYFGRVGVEKRAESAEMLMQTGESIRREAEQQAAQAVARLDVEGMAREAAEKARELAEQGREKAQQLAQAAETKVDEMGQVMGEVTQGMRNMRDRVETFKQELGQVGAAAADLGALVLGGESEAGAAPPPVDTKKLDEMAADIDALLRKAERVQR
jgi:methyl-accepting chemotaxis protein